MSKTITFENKRGEAITGVLKEKNTSGPLLIVNHGFKSSKDHPAISTITDALYKLGHSTFSFNFSKTANGFNLQEQVLDIYSIIQYFKKYKEFIILAPSFGAVNAVISAVQLPKISGIITINGFFGSARLGINVLKTYVLFRLIALFGGSNKNNWRYFKKYYKPEKMKCNALIIHAKHDDTVFVSQSKKFFKQFGGRKQFFILEKADHNLTKPESKNETAKVIDQWLRKWF